MIFLSRIPQRWVILLLAICAVPAIHAAESPWAHPDPTGRLQYQTLPAGDRIMDFSSAGYMGGGVKLPALPVKKTVRPTGGDDSAAIQSAINQVAELPAVNGMRGAVLLDGAKFVCSKPLTISTGGIVLFGIGTTKTIIDMAGAPHVCLEIKGKRSVQSEGKPVKITDAYVPSGTSTFTAESVSGLKVGDTILITRPVTPEWVSFMGMDSLERDGKSEHWISKPLVAERVIKEISGKKITLDIPLSDSLDATQLKPTGATVCKAKITGEISQVGVESLSIVSRPQPVEITVDHNSGIAFDGVADGWVCDVNIVNALGSIDITASRRLTVENVQMEHQSATKGHAKPLDIRIDGSQIFIDRCSGRGDDLFPVATGGSVIGPNVVLNFVFHGNSHLEPHMRWATGLLVDNCHLPEGGIDLMNRGTMGSGHGWAIGWGVAWNCSAKTFVIQQPPGSMNWAIGCRGARETAAQPSSGADKNAPKLPEGIIDSHNNPVLPKSLYLAQLLERLGPQALKNIGY